MDIHRQYWNQQQKILRSALEGKSGQDQAIGLFLEQHAGLHASAMSGTTRHSFADEVWAGLTEEQFRRIPRGEHHSIAWNLWHPARIEDVTMNVLVAGTAQVLDQDEWFARLNTPWRHTGNGMADDEIAALGAGVNMAALRAYRLAVGRRTRAIAAALRPSDFGRNVEPAKIRQIWEQYAMLEHADGIVTYWSRRTIAGLLLMPPTRHNFVHLNEAMRLKGKRE